MTAAVVRLRGPDSLALIVLLLAALAPLGLGRLHTKPQVLPAEGRLRTAREIENRRARAGGELPAWDPYQFGGRPYLASFDTQVAYPPSLLLGLVPVDTAFALGFAFHAWLAGLGAYLVMRQLDATRPASLAGGVAAVLATVAAPALDLAHEMEAQRLAWLPAVLAAAMWSASRRRVLPHPALVAAVVMVLLTASLRTTAYASGVVIAWYVFTALWPEGPSAGRRELLAQCVVLCGLAVGLTAFQTVPLVRLWSSAARAGGLSVHRWSAPPRAVVDKAPLDDALVSALLPVREHRTLSTCSDAVDEADLLALRIPSAGGHGGVFLADYARFVTLASGLYPEKPAVYAGIDGAGHAPARSDLLALLGVEFLVSCEPPDPERWVPVSQAGGVGVHRNLHVLGDAVWTCAAEAVGRRELEYRIRRYRYDANLTLRGAGPLIHVRWVPGIGDADRARAEALLHIVPERFLGDRTWQYELFDSSPANVETIVRNALVEDTAGLNRGSFDVVAAVPDFGGESRTEWLIGSQPCPETRPATVVTPTGVDGRLVADVEAPRDGLVFFRETFYPLRVARVDGEPVAPMKVNLAFTAVPVTAGRHRIELGYDPRGYQAGWWLSLVTALIWVGSGWRSRSRRGTA